MGEVTNNTIEEVQWEEMTQDSPNMTKSKVKVEQLQALEEELPNLEDVTVPKPKVAKLQTLDDQEPITFQNSPNQTSLLNHS